MVVQWLIYTILAQMIASCHDKNNHITIPGFYDDVVKAGTKKESCQQSSYTAKKNIKRNLG